VAQPRDGVGAGRSHALVATQQATVGMATITAIDPATRSVTLAGPGGGPSSCTRAARSRTSLS